MRVQNVVDGCVAGGVPALVYTSSASVVFDGQDLHKVGEACLIISACGEWCAAALRIQAAAAAVCDRDLRKAQVHVFCCRCTSGTCT